MRLSVGALTFDPDSGELTGPAGVARIAPQPASLLALLASRPGDVVTRDEIRERLWPGGRVEFEQGIAFAVREVRRAIESAGGEPDVIETIPKRGFRLAAVASAPAQRVAPEKPAVAGSRRAMVRWVGVAAGVALVALMYSMRDEAPPGLGSTVVVFAHEAEDAGHTELARALGFEMTTALTRALAGRLGVIGPTGVTALSGPDDTDRARASLGACLVVSGGIRGLGADSVVVFTQVVRTIDRVHVWASSDTTWSARASTSVLPRVVEGVESAVGGC
jgi:DNA-binding winged helix-turn-helix (wHTH) protein/TolB-like protein